jgi:predicted nucleic acid-binding protein
VNIVVDTDVISFIAKSDSRASLYEKDLIGQRLCICFQTVAELQLWALLRRWGQTRQAQLNAILNRCIVLRYDVEMAQHWARITAHRRTIGRPIECGDAWIAASAIRHGAALVSHNARHYADIPDLRLITRAT